MNFDKACSLLLERQYLRKKPGLGAFRRCLGRLGNPHLSFKAVHITGTNGKGSVAALIAKSLELSGRKTGLYTSPHVLDVTERIRIDSETISRAEFAAAVSRALSAEREPLTFFELITAAAFLYFAEKKIDIAVVEVGIGGRFDTTNALETSVLGIITSVDLDHTHMLGNTTAAIAYEKSGIMRSGVPCLCGDMDASARGVIVREAKKTGAPLYFASARPRFSLKKEDWARARTVLSDNRGGKPWRIPLLGRHQVLNASLAAKAAELLSGAGLVISDACLRKAFSSVRWPGRFEVLRRGKKTFILDGGHNPQALRGFADTFRRSPFSRRGCCFVIGVMKDKDYRAIAKTLAPLVKKAMVTAPPSGRALDPVQLADYLSSLNPEADISAHSDYRAALACATHSDVIVVVGSFYLVGSALGVISTGSSTARLKIRRKLLKLS